MSGAHHKYGPSSLERRWLCPASARLEEGLPDVENEYSAEGTALHHAAATGDLSGLAPEQKEAVEWAIIQLDGLLEGAEVFKERKLRLVGPLMNIITEGTPDVYAVSIADGKGWLFDYKFGWNEVEEPASNWQMAAYAAMIAQRYALKEVEAVILYPRARRASPAHTFTDFASIVGMIEAAIAACEKPDAACVPGEKQCKYCKAAAHGKCPAQKAQFEADIAKAEAAITTVPLDDLTNDEMAGFYLEFKPKMDALAKFWESVKNRVRYRVEKDGACGSLTLGKGAVVREVKDILAAFDLLAPYLTREEFLGCTSVSASKLEKAFGKKLVEAAAKEGGKLLLKDAKTRFDALMSGVVETKTRKGEIEAANG